MSGSVGVDVEDVRFCLQGTLCCVSPSAAVFGMKLFQDLLGLNIEGVR